MTRRAAERLRRLDETMAVYSSRSRWTEENRGSDPEQVIINSTGKRSSN